MTQTKQEISDAIRFAVAATDRECEGAGLQAPGLEECRFSLFVALMGKLGRGQMRVAQLRNITHSEPDPLVYSAENLVLIVDDVMFDEQGEVDREKLLQRAKEFSEIVATPHTKVVLATPLATMLDQHVMPHLVSSYRKLLDVALDGVALQQTTPSVEAAPPRPRL